MADKPLLINVTQSKDISTKCCTKCKIEKSLAGYSDHRQSKDGKRPDCRDCRSRISKQYYEKNKARLLEKHAARHLADPEKSRLKSKMHYEKNKEHLKKLHKDWKIENKGKVDAIRIAYAEKHRDKHNAYARDWAKNNPEKMKRVRLAHNSKRYAIVRSGLSKNDIDNWLDGQPKCCFYCGCGCEKTFEVDHFYPLSKGGLHELVNLRISCQSCNRRKSAKDPYKFMEEIKCRIAA